MLPLFSQMAEVCDELVYMNGLEDLTFSEIERMDDLLLQLKELQDELKQFLIIEE